MPYRRRRACGAGSSATWGWTSGWCPCRGRGRGRGPGRGPGRPPCSCWAGWRGTELLLLLMNSWCRWEAETGTGEPRRRAELRRHTATSATEPRHSGAGRGWRGTRDTWARGDTRPRLRVPAAVVLLAPAAAALSPSAPHRWLLAG